MGSLANPASVSIAATRSAAAAALRSFRPKRRPASAGQTSSSSFPFAFSKGRMAYRERSSTIILIPW